VTKGRRHLLDPTRLFSFAIPILVIVSPWVVCASHYHVLEPKITNEMVREAREVPSDALLDELKDYRFIDIEWASKQELVNAAEGMLNGQVRIPGYAEARVAVPLSPRDLDRASAAWDLEMAGLVVPDTLIQAYDVTGEEKFLAGAKAILVGWNTYERSAWLPQGELWNDHALAARTCVLANFWRVYRHSANYDPDTARQILDLTERSEELLAKPGLFTFASNHGIMQNLALWHAGLAFPMLPRTQEYQALARTRMTDQMKLYVSNEGTVLENSAGYQLFGVTLLAQAFRYLELMHQSVPKDWVDKYERAKTVYATLRRPDGSLPVFGDTDDGPNLEPLVTKLNSDGHFQTLTRQQMWEPSKAFTQDAVAGYSVWWDGLPTWPDSQHLSQTVVTWSNLPSHTHKHADEMSVIFWAGGQSWWSNVGYWPYNTKGRAQSESWEGSNAPHLAGEKPSSSRRITLIDSGVSDRLAALELKRSGPENYTARRQVIRALPNVWLVVDSTSDPLANYTTTTWTATPDTRWRRTSDDSFVLDSAKDSGNELRVFFLGSQNTTRRLLRGSLEPFAGWRVEKGTPQPAFALMTEQPVNSWAVTVWSWDTKAVSAGSLRTAQISSWTDPANWSVQLQTDSGAMNLSRQASKLRLVNDQGKGDALDLATPIETSHEVMNLRDQFARARAKYRPFNPDLNRLRKLTWILVVLLFFQELFLYSLSSKVGFSLNRFRLATAILWMAGGIWLVGWYL
jgi:heparinase II/III-like protein